jgi:hypothetical protein
MKALQKKAVKDGVVWPTVSSSAPAGPTPGRRRPGLAQGSPTRRDTTPGDATGRSLA